MPSPFRSIGFFIEVVRSDLSVRLWRVNLDIVELFFVGDMERPRPVANVAYDFPSTTPRHFLILCRDTALTFRVLLASC